MTAACHPTDELLFAYAAGSLDEASSLLIASHATLCPHCRRQIALGEEVGGTVLETLPPDDLGDEALLSVMARLDNAPQAAPEPRQRAKAAEEFPAPLAHYFAAPDVDQGWRWWAPGVKQRLVMRNNQARVRLLKIAPGKPMPHHRHGGLEYTLVLSGGFSDESGDYDVGDFTIADDQVVHQPVASAEGCICLTMSCAPLQLTSRFGRLINPFLPF
jgi:putative transcriptional regulator